LKRKQRFREAYGLIPDPLVVALPRRRDRDRNRRRIVVFPRDESKIERRAGVRRLLALRGHVENRPLERDILSRLLVPQVSAGAVLSLRQRRQDHPVPTNQTGIDSTFDAVPIPVHASAAVRATPARYATASLAEGHR